MKEVSAAPSNNQKFPSRPVCFFFVDMKKEHLLSVWDMRVGRKDACNDMKQVKCSLDAIDSRSSRYLQATTLKIMLYSLHPHKW